VFDAALTKTRADTEHALDLLDTLVDGFDFATPLDRAVAIAALITAFVRPRLRTAPLFIIGARRLAEIAAALAGRPLSTLALSGAAASADVAIRATLNDHPATLLLDTKWWTGSPFGGPHLAAALDGQVIARIPGTTRVEPVTATVFAIGPVPELTKEIARSVLDIRMADPGFDPTPRAGEYREFYRAAAEDIAGPGSEWSDVVRAPLVALGLPDPTEALGRLPVERINR
jgi:putative DNA primase/helicase